ncbi:substrate-binding periplasmic protein [Bdellovibrio sp. HCB274]|uniref:substrate-binding periplasmic protein n=1 Tax=Bdellovibrio sp. HCB274 TaxID=3394361 RepID=UPI0039B51167
MAQYFAWIFIILLLAAPAFPDEKVYTLVTIENASKISSYKELGDMMTAVLKDSGIKSRIIEMPVERGMRLVDSGQADFFIASDLAIQDTYKNLVPSSFPFIKTHIWVFHRADDSRFQNKNPTPQMNGVALLNDPAVSAIVKKKKLKVIGVQSSMAGLQMLLTRRADFYVGTMGTVDVLLAATPGERKKISNVKEPLAPYDVYFWAHKKHAALMPTISKNLKKAMSKKATVK